MFRADSIVKWLVLTAALVVQTAQAEREIIGIIVEKEDTATYIETLEGFWSEVERSAVEYDYIIRNSKNNRERMAILAKEFSGNESIRSVVILGSAAAAIGTRHIVNKPLVFGGVNHPKKLGIHGENVTGTTYFISPDSVVNLIQRLDPRVRRIGLLYEPSSQNKASFVEVPGIEAAAKERGLELVKESVRTKNDISAKTKRLTDRKIEFLIIPTNKLLYSNVELIRSITDPLKVPVVSFSRKGVYDGAMIGLTSDNRKLGEKMGQILIDITENNKKPKEIEWHFPKQYTIMINDGTRTELDVQIPQRIYSIATKINRAVRR